MNLEAKLKYLQLDQEAFVKVFLEQFVATTPRTSETEDASSKGPYMMQQ